MRVYSFAYIWEFLWWIVLAFECSANWKQNTTLCMRQVKITRSHAHVHCFTCQFDKYELTERTTIRICFHSKHMTLGIAQYWLLVVFFFYFIFCANIKADKITDGLVVICQQFEHHSSVQKEVFFDRICFFFVWFYKKKLCRVLSVCVF